MKQEERNKLLDTLRERFEKNRNRHEGIEWKDVLGKLESNDEKLKVLQKMEISGGEPDMVAYDREKDEYVFFDCSPESPAGRRACVTIMKHGNPGKQTSQQAVLLAWQKKWA
mgnify:CR=1 FL=1